MGTPSGLRVSACRQTPRVGCVCASTNTCNFKPDILLQTPNLWLFKTTNREPSQPERGSLPVLSLRSNHSRYLGVTRPITTAESNPREKEVTATLLEELKRQKTFESDQEARTR